MLLFQLLVMWQGSPATAGEVLLFVDPTLPLPAPSGPAIPVTVSRNGVTAPYIVGG